MPDFDPQKPRYTLVIGKKEYDLEGSFAMIEAVENALKDHVFNIITRCINMPSSDMAKLISAILSANNIRLSPKEIGEIMWNEVGVVGDDYTVLCLNVHAFLRITIAKPKDRQEETTKMGELLGSLTKKLDSNGDNTSNSPSEL